MSKQQDDTININILTPATDKREQLETEPSVLVVPDTVNDRYASFEFISWWDQACLRNATVMVVGAGALGNEVLKNLALMGVGRLLIVDFDTVELGNLSRSMLFRASDSGRTKAEAAAEAIKNLNPDVAVQPLHMDITTDLGLGLLRHVDVIIGCLDNREARLQLNNYAYRLNQPWVDGAIQELLGIARIFWPGQGACYECTLTAADWAAINLRYSCTLLARERLLEGKVPTTPTVASIIAGIQVQEALKILHGMEVQAGQGFVFNGLTNYAYTVKYPQRSDCLNHEEHYDPIQELPKQATDTTTVGEILDIARQHLGPNAQLELDYELVTHFRCPGCGREEEVYQPLRKLHAHVAQCPDCNQQRQAVSTHRITGYEAFLNRTLKEIGLPLFHILGARFEGRYAYFELTGDSALFSQWD